MSPVRLGTPYSCSLLSESSFFETLSEVGPLTEEVKNRGVVGVSFSYITILAMVGPPSNNTSPMGKDYMYRHVKNRNFDFEAPTPTLGSIQRGTILSERQRSHQQKVDQKREEEAEHNSHLLKLKKREQAEERLRIRSRDNQLDTMWNDPMAVVESLRERCRQKSHLLINMFPPKNTGQMGLLCLEDISRGLGMMGFNLTQQKLQMVLTILGVGCLLQPGKTIPLVQLKTAILDKNLEKHHEKTEWMSRGGGGKLSDNWFRQLRD